MIIDLHGHLDLLDYEKRGFSMEDVVAAAKEHGIPSATMNEKLIHHCQPLSILIYMR